MIVQLGVLNYKVLILFLSPIILQTQRFTENKLKHYTALGGFNDFLSFIICGALYLLANKCSKTEKEKEQEKEKEKENQLKQKVQELNVLNQNKNLNDDIEITKPDAPTNTMAKIKIDILEKEEKKGKVNKKKQFLLIILISFLILIGTFIKNVFREDLRSQLQINISVLLESIFLITFSVIFLGFSMYFHQYVSYAVLAICLIIFFIETLFFDDLKTSEIIGGIFYFFCSEISYCLGDVLGKKYLNTYRDGVYLFLFKIGIVGIVPIIIYDIIAFSCGLDPKYHGVIQIIFVEGRIGEFLLNLFFCLLFEISLWLTIYNFSPCHFIILETLGDFCQIIISLIKGNNKNYDNKQIITFLILYPVIIVSVLVFNEIIILNFCRLNYNTKYYIMKREREEIDCSVSEENLLSNDEDD